MLLTVAVASLAQPSPGQEQGGQPNAQGDGPPLAVPAPPARQIAISQPEATDTNQHPWYRDEWAMWFGEKFWDIEWSNWALLIAAVWAGKLALRTLKTQTTQIQIGRSALNSSRVAAEAAKSAAHTADMALRLVHQQWLDFDRWDVVDVSAGESTVLDVTFHIVNNTPMELTILHTKTQILDTGHEGEVDSDERVPLAPRRDYPGSSPLYHLAETAEEFSAYMRMALRITLVGEVTFIDAFGDERTQRFGCMCVGGKLHKAEPRWEFSSFDGVLGSAKPDKQNDKG